MDLFGNPKNDSYIHIIIKIKVMKEQIMEILEMGIKPDGSFYNVEEKAELLDLLFNEESKKIFDKGWLVGYYRGVRDAQTPSGW